MTVFYLTVHARLMVRHDLNLNVYDHLTEPVGKDIKTIIYKFKVDICAKILIYFAAHSVLWRSKIYGLAVTLKYSAAHSELYDHDPCPQRI